MKTIVLALLISVLALSGASPPDFTIKLGGKLRSLGDLEQIVKDHTKRNKITFEFVGSTKRVSIDTDYPDVITVAFRSRGGSPVMYATIDKAAMVVKCDVHHLSGGPW